MKEIYQKPEIELENFKSVDILTQSGTASGGGIDNSYDEL